MVMNEDLSVFFSTDDFAVTATYNGATTVSGLFDAAYAEAFGVSGFGPAFTGKAADFPVSGTPVGKSLAIDGVTYTIKAREALDDGALVLLRLQKAS